MSIEDETDAMLGHLYDDLDAHDEADFLARMDANPSLRDEVEADAALLSSFRQADLDEAPPPGLLRLALAEAERRPRPWTRRLGDWLVGHAGRLSLASAVVGVFGLVVVSGQSWLGRAPERAPLAAKPATEPVLAPASEAEPPPAEDAEDAFEDVAEVEAEADALDERPAPKAAAAPRPQKKARKAKAERKTAPSRPRRSVSSERGHGEALREGGEPEGLLGRASKSSPPPDLDDAMDGFRPGSAGGAPSAATRGMRALDEEVGAKREARVSNEGAQAEAGRVLLTAAVQARAQGRLGEARQALVRAAQRVYRLPMLGEVLLLRAEVELQDRQYEAARRYADKAAAVEGFAERARARRLSDQARRAADHPTN